MGSLSSNQATDSEQLSAEEFVSCAHADPMERLRVGMEARTIAHTLQEVFAKDDQKGGSALDLDRIFSGLFEHPSHRDRDERCAIGRVQECMGEPTIEKLKCVVEVSKNPQFEFLQKVVYRILESGSLVQKKMAAQVLKAVDPTMASVVRALEQLVDKPQEENTQSSKGGIPHKALICPNIGGDPHQ